jgi:hypothetical protein
MSRHRRRDLDRGIAQPLVEREFRPRASRHGKPVTKRVRSIVEQPDGTLKVVFSQQPVTGPQKRKASAGPTGTHGKRNSAPTKKGVA